MTPMSEVVLRQKSQLTNKILLINPPQDGLVQELNVESIDIWTWHYADYQYFKKYSSVQTLHFGIEFPFEQNHQQHYQHIIIFNPKIKQQLHYILHHLAVYCALNTSILLVGEKKAGIEGSAKLLKDYGKSSKIDMARHCQLWQLFLQQKASLRPLSSWQKSYRLEFKQHHLEIVSLVGVFSQNKLT